MNTMLKAVVSMGLLSGLVTGVQASESPHGVSGYVGVVSQYILRGNVLESDTPALQGGIEYEHASGFYAGYWFSTLSYSYKDLQAGTTPNYVPEEKKSMEHDFYAGYNGSVGDVGFTVGGTVYYYYPGWESTGYETLLGVNYGGFGLTAQTLLNDVTFGNKGDTYFVASYEHELPMDFTLTGKLTAYKYTKKGDFVAEFNDDGKRAKSAAFRHASLGLSKPLGETGGTWGVEYILAGPDRYGVKQDNKMVGSLSFAF